MVRYIDFAVEGQEIRLLAAEETSPAPRGDTREYLFARFCFAGAWINLEKTAIFTRAGMEPIKVVLNAEGVCPIPPELLVTREARYMLEIGVGLVGYGADGLRLPTGTASIHLRPS
ncbi:MAG: hypothetical protein J6W14_01510 [Clostridia bacterium]|nr:hypothetical protein [Clostridia bacterium]